MTRAVLLLLSFAGLAGTAVAEDAPGHGTDPVAQRAGEEANLESNEHRQGFTFAFAIGPSVTVGGGAGTGGGLSIRVGQVIRPNAVVLVEATGNAQRHEVMREAKTNDYSSILAGLQVWLGPFAYFRVAGGFGSYRCSQCKDPDDSGNIMPIDYRRRGITGLGAFGFEPLRLGSVTIGPEAMGVMTLTPDGVILSLSLMLVVGVD